MFSLAELSARGRTILWSVVALLVLTIFFVVFRSERDFRKEFSFNKGNSYMEGLKIINRKDGTDAWMISARKADFSKDETMVQLSSVTIDIKKEGAVLNADGGTYNMNTRDLRLDRNIVIRTKDSTISTDSLSWDPASRTISSEGKVTMQGSRFRIEGEGLSAAEDNRITLKRNVKANFF